MGRSLLLLCASALLVGALAMGNVRRNTSEQDRRLSSFEADVIARENAISAVNQAVPFITTRFDSLVAGQEVHATALVGRGLSNVRGVSTQGDIDCRPYRGSWAAWWNSVRSNGNQWGLLNHLQTTLTAEDACQTFVGVERLRVARSNRLRLTGTTVATLLPTRTLTAGGSHDATVRNRGDGTIEVTATGTYVVPGPNGQPAPRTFTVRRVYAKASALDAAVIALAPSITPTFSGAYLFDGRDIHPATGAPSGNTSRYRNAIKTNSAAVAKRLGAVIGTANKARAMGVGGQGDIVYGGIQSDLDAIFDEAYTHPRRVDIASVQTTATYGSGASPQVVVATDSLRISGTLTGTGILIVNGDLKTVGTGRLVWDGVVMVRKDGSWSGPSANLTTSLGPASKITGSLVLFQGSAAMVMPFNGRVKVTYLGSWDAGLLSSVGIEHSHEGDATYHQLVAPGANRVGSVVNSYDADLQAGQQLNFYIGVHYPSWYRDARLAGTEAYRNFARGHFDPVTGKPYGISEKTGDYQWRMAFEDLRQGTDIGFGSTPDWDYDQFEREDQVIQVSLQCRQYRSGTLVTTNGQPTYGDCTPDNPDTRLADTRLDWNGLTATSGVVASPEHGTNLRLLINGTQVLHSTASIARLAPLLETIRSQTQLVLVDSWTSL